MQPRVRVVGTASPNDEAAATAAKPDVFVVDVSSPEGLAAVGRLRERRPVPKVVAMGVPEREHDVIACVEAGVSGFVLADEHVGQLVASIESSVRGEVRCSPRFAAVLAQRVTALAAAQQKIPPGVNLTARELEIVQLIDDGLSNKEIAHVLHIEVATVKNHVHNVLEKLQVSRRTEAAALVRGAFRERRTDRIEVLGRDERSAAR